MSAETCSGTDAGLRPAGPRMESALPWGTGERILPPGDGLLEWFDTICPSFLSRVGRQGNPSNRPVDPDLPSWEALRLVATSLVRGEGFRLEPSPPGRGDILELVLGSSGHELGRCLALRDGTFLCDPTGPDWARKILVEAVAEWRLEAD